ADGKEYLVGGRFSRADIAVASLLSPLALPPEHPVYNKLRHPPRLARQVAEWNDRHSLRWTRRLYATHR
ncbi:MAG: glutathione S-transferase family protein, partial [Woeseiaceae bacterium]